MHYLKKLDLQGIRNLQQVQLSFAPRINLFYGNNGSGKTSLLESIYLLARGRSFRTRNPLNVMASDAESFLSVGYLCSQEEDLPAKPIGVQRLRNGSFTMKVAGEVVNTTSRLAEALPLLLLNADSFGLLDAGPGGRRRYLDWGVFHVEHGYRELWKRFQRALKQRNSLFRHDRIDSDLLASWDKEFVGLSEQIDRFRLAYSEKLIPIIQQAFTELCGDEVLGDSIKFSYYPGWNQKHTLHDLLLENRDRDFRFGATQQGPHRADLKVRCGRVGAAEVLSRGQAKILVCAMQIAQGQLFKQLTGLRSVYLLDDLPAELDENHRRAVGSLLSNVQAQVFVTGVEKQDLLDIWPAVAQEELALFHVEQGKISSEIV